MFEPHLLLNTEIARSNISRMLTKCKDNNIVYRPHFKTHQSAEIGELYRELGVDCITCSSFKMASYFADNGWTDITVAITVNQYYADDINALASKINLNILVEDVAVINELEAQITSPVGLFIKIDAGYHRTGVDVEDFDQIKKLLGALKLCKNLIFIGFLGHAGNTYDARGKEQIIDLATPAMHQFVALKVFLKDEFPLMQLSWGDTPSCSVLEHFEGIDELRPGNMVFYDYVQSIIGSCELPDIAVCMKVSVIAVHPKRNQVIVHCGAVHLSKDRVELPDGTISFGKVVEIDGNSWDINKEVGEVIALSQEHGTIRVGDDLMHSIKPGDTLAILPVHSCLTVNLMKEMYTNSGQKITCMR